MTDYKNELRSVLYDFLGDFKEKRYLSEGNTDEAIAKLEALLSQRELEARLEEVQAAVRNLSERKGRETWEEWSFRVLGYYEGRIDKLTNREEK